MRGRSPSRVSPATHARHRTDIHARPPDARPTLGRKFAAALAALLAFSVFVLVGAALLYACEHENEKSTALAYQTQENSYRAYLGLEPKGRKRQLSLTANPDMMSYVSAVDSFISNFNASAPNECITYVQQQFPALLSFGEDMDQAKAATFNLSYFYEEQIRRCKGPPSEPVSLNWDYKGSVFFFFTIMTTIGYGTFAPTTSAGRLVVVTFGAISLIGASIFFGICSAAYSTAIEQLARKVIPVDGVVSRRRRLHVRLVLAVVIVYSYMALCAHLAYTVDRADFPNFLSAFYFSFVTLSTIGLGDFTVLPKGDSVKDFAQLALQILIVLVGLVMWEEFVVLGRTLWNQQAHEHMQTHRASGTGHGPPSGVPPDGAPYSKPCAQAGEGSTRGCDTAIANGSCEQGSGEAVAGDDALGVANGRATGDGAKGKLTAKNDDAERKVHPFEAKDDP